MAGRLAGEPSERGVEERLKKGEKDVNNNLSYL
jgi:hypothetical protein